MNLFKWTIGKKMFLMGLGVVIALGVLGGMFYYTTETIQRGTDASAERNHQLGLANQLDISTLTLILAAMDAIIDKDTGEIAEEEMQIITTNIAYIQENLPELSNLADTDAEKQAAQEMLDVFPKLAEEIQVTLVTLIKESATTLQDIENQFIQIDDTLDQYGDQIEQNLRIVATSVQDEQTKSSELMLLRNEQMALLDKFLRAQAAIMLEAMNVIIDRGAGRMTDAQKTTIDTNIAFINANMQVLEDLADTEEEGMAVAIIRDTFPKLVKGVQEDLPRLLSQFGQEEDFARLDDELDEYDEQIQENLGIIFASVQQEQVIATEAASLRNQQMNLLNRLTEAHSNVMLGAMDSIIDKDEGDINEERLQSITSNLEFINNSLKKLEELANTEEEQQAVQRIQQIFPLLAEGIQVNLLKLIREGAVTAQQIQADFARIDDELDGYGDTIRENLDLIVASVQQEQREAETGLKDLIEEIAFIGAVIVAAVLVILIPTFFLFSRSISKPLVESADVATRLANGDLAVNVKVRGRDETGQLLNAMQHMVEKLQEIVIVVKGGALNVSSGSQEMAQGAAEQAAAAEEASSSMEEMAANIRQNADNALQTEKIAVSAAENARNSGTAVTETVRAMRDIAQRITIVEEIARQTHMLSLNATIEAAKAQDYGRGFGVVAAEVRALAERSRTAATEINSLANSSVSTAEQAGELLTKLVPDIQKTAELVQEISAASREQNSGAEQINRAIQQLDQVIQQNASVSEELASQAEQLQSTINFFNTDGGMRTTATTRKEGVSAFGKVAHIKAPEVGGAALPGVKLEMEQQEAKGDDRDDEFERY